MPRMTLFVKRQSKRIFFVKIGFSQIKTPYLFRKTKKIKYLPVRFQFRIALSSVICVLHENQDSEQIFVKKTGIDWICTRI
jgi:hypothetical protein